MNKSRLIKLELERKGYKFRLNIANSDIENKLAQYAGSCRFVWNKALALIKQDEEEYRTIVEMFKLAGATNKEVETVKREFKFNPYNQLSGMLPEWKVNPTTQFLADSYSKSLQITLEELGLAIVDAKNLTNPKHYPVFKRRGNRDSFSFNGTIKHDAVNGRIFVPKLGYISYNKSREVLGTIKNVTISKESNNWYVSLQAEKLLTHVNPALVDSNKIIGIDVGVTKTISCSDHINFKYQNQQISTNQLESINPLRQYQDKLARFQRELSRKIKFSKNWCKLKAKISKLHTKIANIRKDFIHKITTAITKNYAYVVIEKLKITNMSKSAKGTLEKPGKNIKQKAGLNKSILDQGWGMLKQFLTYKLKYRYGTELIEINPKYTSQKCSCCGYTDKDNRESQAKFNCKSCGLTMNADINAALNIKAAGLAVMDTSVLACGGIDMSQPMKQEPTELDNIAIA